MLCEVNGSLIDYVAIDDFCFVVRLQDQSAVGLFCFA